MNFKLVFPTLRVKTLCWFLLVLNVGGFLLENEKSCPSEAFIRLTFNETLNIVNGSESVNETVECPCLTRACLPLCCPFGNRVGRNECIPLDNKSDIKFPALHDPETREPHPGKLRIENYHVFTWDPCRGGDRYRLQPEETAEDEFKFLANGSIYRTYQDDVIDFTNYCLGVVDEDSYSVVLCFDDMESDGSDTEAANSRIAVAFPVGMILSVPFLLITFLVYSVIPELKNMHGATLRGYVGPLIVAYTLLAVVQIAPQEKIPDTLCILMGIFIII